MWKTAFKNLKRYNLLEADQISTYISISTKLLVIYLPVENSNYVLCQYHYIFRKNFDGVKFIVHVKFRSSHPEVLLGKGILEICYKLIREQPYRSAISIKLLYNFTEITLRHGCSPINLLHIFRLPFPKNPSGRLLLKILKVLLRFSFPSS